MPQHSIRQLNPGEREALTDPQVFTHYTGGVLRGISYKRVDRGWQVIFRAHMPGKGDVYCLSVAVALEHAIATLFAMVASKGGSRYWYPDKFA